ncbi:hypothetical protein HYQ46_001600 [Verticillium longisporum]|nr:hypothetical protein HYQ46_001600 [Verticillium longisporum]
MPTALPSRVSRVHLSSTTPTTMHDGGRQGRVGFLEWTRWARYQEAKTVVILIHRERSGSITSLHLARSPRAQAHEPGFLGLVSYTDLETPDDATPREV